ncbi:hydrogen peroxide-inducible genes activator [Ohtaekwangia koreensis]|jgi:LysR family transcriptional regulator, hydrogen peroxide-inducible genes activator|uniref:LysR family transcriptional regulator, hydrogen peroxide-inducible genes activator n=1 Tax=Ohtaekwangia koreensis TaxID=688867 RepID=A0A1T5MM59_9BACT|nr:hydrogen peroxide-inducible genes activator [Ohtaekwangia koreensis]SKC89084.1 LysR family transcriptional regulator, hydrogen peroxide-inducible genes activator [Ohtaekwangia koreensis]
MNLQQLEYIIALDIHRNHSKAAEHCHVTQPTLSMMVKKLEDELEVKIFQKTQPLKPTPSGEIIISRARQILQEVKNLKEFIRSEKDSIEGEFRLGVIPTLAPYLLPRFLNEFLQKHPGTSFTVMELQTHEIINYLKTNRLDVAILVTPLDDKDIREVPIFYEPILLYTSENLKYYQQERINLKTLSYDNLLLLEEGHCFRGQVENLCSAKNGKVHHQLNYQSGSFETLKAMVDNNYGYTLIPELAVNSKSKHVKRFVSPEPVREVSLAVHSGFVKENLLFKLREAIMKVIPPHFKKNDKYIRVRWD